MKFIFFSLILLFSLEESFALEIIPGRIDLGFVPKDKLYQKKIIVKNNTNTIINILGSIDTCGVSIKINPSVLKPNDVVVGELNIYTGSSLGEFNLVSYIIVKTEEIKKNPINVSFYVKPEEVPYVLPVNKFINLGEIGVTKKKKFFFDLVNITNSFASLKLRFKEPEIDVPQHIDINPNSKITVKGEISGTNPGKREKVLIYEYNNPASDVRIVVNYGLVESETPLFSLETQEDENGVTYLFKTKNKNRVYIFDLDEKLKPVDIKILKDKLEFRKKKKEDRNIKYFLLGITHEY